MLCDKIIAYLSANNIPWTASDFRTEQPEGGEDHIAYWSDALGSVPSSGELDAAETKLREQEERAANKARASRLLQASDWVEVPSVSDTAVTPHLINKEEFMAYRMILRAIAVNPPVSPAYFPPYPAEKWQS